MAKFSDKYDLDGVANVEAKEEMAPISFFPTGKGSHDLDGVESVQDSASLTYKPDDAFGKGAPVQLDATTGLPMGEGARSEYAGGTGDVTAWPKAFED